MQPRFSRRAILASAVAAPEPRPAWPVIDDLEEKALLQTLHGGKWSRSYGGARAAEFEQRYAALTGAKFCLATANGTSALVASLNALDVGPGDAVLLSTYTFVATLNAVLVQHALPVFVDTDIETFQLDAAKIASTYAPEARAIIPVHIGGSAADLDGVLEAARKRGLKVIEDACQAHLAEWRGRKLGSLGECGCFSFQASKNLNCGEGGALITSDEELFSRAYSYHTNGRAWKSSAGGLAYVRNGSNLRLTEFQAALLVAQMTRVEEQSRLRDANARYLAEMLAKIPGMTPARMYAGCTRNAWHLFMFRYDERSGVERAQFFRNLKARGVDASSGYTPLNREPFLAEVLRSRHYLRIYGEKRLKEWHEANTCPQNERLCREAAWLPQTVLLGTRAEMERIAEAVAAARR